MRVRTVLMFERDALKPIERLITAWDASGVLHVYDASTCHVQHVFGYADRNRHVNTSNTPSYLLSVRSRFLQGLAIMQLVEAGQLDLDAPIGPLLPEYPPAAQVTIRQLLLHESGIKDYFYGHIMLNLSASASHQMLDDNRRYVLESQLFYQSMPWHEMIDTLGETLLFKPGTQDYWSATNSVILERLIEQTSGLSIQTYLETRIFAPLGLEETILGHQANTVSYVCMRDIHLLEARYEGDTSLVYTTTPADIAKLMHGLRTKALLSSKSWQDGLKPNAHGAAILCDYRNGFEYYESMVLGYEIGLFVDAASQCAFFHMSNEGSIFRLQAGEWTHFLHQIRCHIEAYITKPRQTVLEPYHERNAWDAMHLRMAKDQEEFVIDAKTSLCWALSEPKDKRPYVLMEGMRSVGLMILAIDQDKDIYKIDILIVDARYQNRGFGKIMLQKGLDILKDAGAKQFDIIVNRFNTPAYRMYRSLGFEETGIYEGGVRLSKPL
ncbi:MAG: GNAT family N-acetyltransferase [Acholeplasmatales bacterium]|nr:MAG: GNAT family N-acetyltransferase [Acholeplasmatales bacterium]